MDAVQSDAEIRRSRSYRAVVDSAIVDITTCSPTTTTTQQPEADAAPQGRDPENPVVMAILDGDSFDAFFAEGALPSTHPFHWDSVSADPKGDHGTFSTRWFQTQTYHLLHTGGFLRLANERGRVYWLAQNEVGHCTPDWKIHFSIAPRGLDTTITTTTITTTTALDDASEDGGQQPVDLAELSTLQLWERDIGIAWNILAALFLERCCEVGMKARYSPWLDTGQRGRELTVYVYNFSPEYDIGHKGGPMEGLSPPGLEHLHHLGYEHEALFAGSFWMLFIQEAEARLAQAGLVPAGLADGDLALPVCRFASIRNEAYIPVPQNTGGNLAGRAQPEYPPNDSGWNAAGHPNPLEETYHLLAASATQRFIQALCGGDHAVVNRRSDNM